MATLKDISEKQDKLLELQRQQGEKLSKVHDAIAGDEYRKGMRSELDELHEASGTRWRSTKIGAGLVFIYEAVKQLIEYSN